MLVAKVALSCVKLGVNIMRLVVEKREQQHMLTEPGHVNSMFQRDTKYQAWNK